MTHRSLGTLHVFSQQKFRIRLLEDFRFANFGPVLMKFLEFSRLPSRIGIKSKTPCLLSPSVNLYIIFFTKNVVSKSQASKHQLPSFYANKLLKLIMEFRFRHFVFLCATSWCKKSLCRGGKHDGTARQGECKLFAFSR